jgi:thiol:disulfide interchange protein DsbD
MKSVKLMLIAVILMISTMSYSQIMEPVKWKFSKKNLGENIYELTFKATIQDHWHVYTQDNDASPTVFTFEKNENIELVGKVVEKSKVIEIFDNNLGMRLKYFEHKAVFVQKIKVKTKKQIILEGYLEYMACDDKRCMPPTEEDFEFEFNNNKK